MSGGFLRRMAGLHTWLGLWVGWTAYFIFLAGASGYFDTELDRWMQPELPLRPPVYSAPDAVTSITRALHYLQSQPGARQATRWDIVVPHAHQEPHLRVAWRQLDANGRPTATGKLLDYDGITAPSARKTGGGYALYRLHVELRYLPRRMGFIIAGICAMGVLLSVLTGIILHKRIFSDFFTFRPARRARSWLDAHVTVGTVAIPFLLFMSYSGLVFLNSSYMPLLFDANFGENGRSRYIDSVFMDYPIPAAVGVPAHLAAPRQIIDAAERQWGSGRILSYTVWNPGDANSRIGVGRERNGLERGMEKLLFDGVSGRLLEAREPYRSAAKRAYDAILGVHEGNFANGWLRGLYFIAGLLGASVIATGMIVWVEKRLQRRTGPAFPLGLIVMQRLNAGVIAGLPIGMAAYLWANRLLPDIGNRAAWEINALFLAWAACLLYACWQNSNRRWIDLTRLAAGAYLLLPVVNLLATERHLLKTLPAGDWGLAGVDLVALVLGAAFWLAAGKLKSRITDSSSARRIAASLRDEGVGSS